MATATQKRGITIPPKTNLYKWGLRNITSLFDLTQLNLQKTSDSLFMNNIQHENIAATGCGS